MLSKRVVFVLGAGASKPFDFPTGRELRDRVIAGLRPRNQLFEQVQRFGGFSEERIISFRDTLRDSSRKSVDLFLEHRREFMDIGKFVISAMLVGHEQHMLIFDNNAAEWMGYLFDHIGHALATHAGKVPFNVAFVTFNYDRSLEHFLFTAIHNSYRLDELECTNRLSAIPIIHLHGALGRLPWQAENGLAPRAYSNEITTEMLKIAASGIKIVHEDLSDGRDAEFIRAKNLIASAERVYFLGFGDGTVNAERLGLRYIQCPSVGTGSELTDQEIGNIRRTVDSKIAITNQDCMSFLRNTVEWD